MAKTLITPEQYDSLTVIGREIHKYWKQFKPEMYKEMHREGTLWEVLQSEDQRLYEMMCEMMQQGMREHEAMEVVRAQIYDELMD